MRQPDRGVLFPDGVFRLCLDRLGPDEAAARLVCVFGDHQSETIPARWQPYFDRIEVHWAHAPGADNPCHAAQHNMRFDLLDPGADLSLLCDADVAVMAPVTPLAQSLSEIPSLAGVIAHMHFPWGDRPRDPARDWPELAQAVLGRDLARPYRYTLMPADRPPETPFYINFGMFAGPPALLAAFHARDMELRPKVAAHLGEWWAPQVSLALTCADLNVPLRALPMRYNFPNDPRADRQYPDEMAQTVFLHYLRGQEFRREEVFADNSAFQAFLQKPMEGSNALFQRFVAGVTGGRYPFD
ncbi:hypothetical protein [Tropicibacter oceani]|uniref:Glycosyl transferase n=1 Tax=Tropicibacter oceani TaxID=3058420 RepID=A0ABY8QND1_9RHOB|nr:hypothetical protein [Tropicibacter oceani]WGW06055.1 hypothetical protein QF118_19610 [Tropicibacter oceani]